MLVVSFRSLDNALNHRVAVRTTLGFAALGDLPGTYPWTQVPLRRVIRRWDAGIIQEPQQATAPMVLEKPFTQSLVHLALQGWVVQQRGDAGLDGVSGTPVLVQGEFLTAELTMQPMRVLESLEQPGRVDDAPSTAAFLEYHRFLDVANDVPDALLVLTADEHRVIVDRSAVRDQRALERGPQQLLELLMSVLGADLKQHMLRRTGHLQPGLHAIDAPTGVVLMNHRCGLNSVLDLPVRLGHGGACRCRALAGLTDCALRDLHPAQLVQHVRHFALRETHTMVQILRRREQPRTELMGRRAPLGGTQIGVFASNILPALWACRVG
jgi:hypothetical protein